MVKVKGKVLFGDVFCGAYFTFAVSKEGGGVYGFGLSNYHQLGACRATSQRNLLWCCCVKCLFVLVY